MLKNLTCIVCFFMFVFVTNFKLSTNPKISRMTQIKQRKWDNGVAVSKGQQAVSLLDAYKAELSERLPNDFTEQFKANVNELYQRLSGQGSNLSEQKSSTSAQAATISNIQTLG